MLWISFGFVFLMVSIIRGVAVLSVGVSLGVLGRHVMVFYASIAGFAC